MYQYSTSTCIQNTIQMYNGTKYTVDVSANANSCRSELVVNKAFSRQSSRLTKDHAEQVFLRGLMVCNVLNINKGCCLSVFISMRPNHLTAT